MDTILSRPIATLDVLLHALHQAGLHVGVTEMLRVQQVFARQPECVSGDEAEARRRFKALLRALVVKSEDERKTFERVCDIWLQQAAQEVEPLTASPTSPGTDRSEDRQTTARAPRTRHTLWALTSVLALLLTVGLVCWVLSPRPPLPSDTPSSTPRPPDPAVPVTDTRTHPRQRTFTNYEPQLPPSLGLLPQPHFWILGLSVLGTFTAAAVWGSLRRRRFLPEPVPAPTRPGPPRVFLTPPALQEPQLLDTRQQETLVWGIDRFIADEPTRHLDLAATVQATARAGGLPTLHYEAATYQREVWLWVDDAAEDSAITRLAEEVETTLKVHGLAVERARFRGLPERLLTATGEVLAPRELDERREAVLVAVLTDGRVLSRLYSADNRRVRIEALLRDLSHWPRLAFVDFSTGSQTLAAMLARHALPCIAPADLAAFLGAETAPRYAREMHGDDAVWAAACALAPSSVDEATILQLLQHLQQHCGLSVSPWALRALRAEAPGPGGRLQWALSQRVARLNWLRDMEAAADRKGLARSSVLDAALAFWETQLQQEFARREGNEAAEAWRDTPAQQHLSMEYQLLRLWRLPAAAIPALYRLSQGRLGNTLRQHLSAYVPADLAAAGAIRFPWSWQSRSTTEQAMLQDMGLGGGLPRTQLQRPGRLWLGLGACAGLAMGASLALWLRPEPLPLQPPPPQVVHGATLPAALKPYVGHWIDPQPTATGRWRLAVTAPRAVTVDSGTAAATVRVDWQAHQRPCVSTLADDAELWSCGYLTRPERLGPEVQRSLAVLRAKTGVTAVEALAIALLDSGSVDVVLIASDWTAFREQLIGVHDRLGAKQQLMVIGALGEEATVMPLQTAGGRVVQVQSDDWPALRERLRFAGEKRLIDVWTPGTSVHLRGDADWVRLHGLGAWPDVTFVQIPAGTFMMGSPAGEVGRSSDEGPQHQVTMQAFQMARTETTNAQWRAFRPEHKGEDDLPVAGVSWDEARTFCAYYGWRLPTEAEWEYAARAGTDTRWSFGDDERKLGEYAWYTANAQNQSHPVGRKLANPWGLFDMQGNVWEWVQDCWHDNYEGAPTDGSAWETDNCTFRVVRGGSFIRPPADLRSASQGFVQPGYQVASLGFRCVRGSPQP